MSAVAVSTPRWGSGLNVWIQLREVFPLSAFLHILIGELPGSGLTQVGVAVRSVQ